MDGRRGSSWFRVGRINVHGGGARGCGGHRGRTVLLVPSGPYALGWGRRSTDQRHTDRGALDVPVQAEVEEVGYVVEGEEIGEGGTAFI